MTSEHPYGWLSLLPPLVAIVMAIVTRRIFLALFTGIFFGALVVSQWRPVDAIRVACNDHLLPKLFDQGTLQIFGFTLLMGAMVGVINRSGGMRGLVNVMTPLASNRERGQLTTWFLGLLIFFDDYANTVLLGNTLRPLTDKLKISREKLAYIVDSTAAPVAGLALISTWVAAEIDYVQMGLEKLPANPEVSALDLFIASIPYRFYVVWALCFVLIVALIGRDFGPMLHAEKKSQDETGNESQNAIGGVVDPTSPEPETKSRWFNAVIPVVVTVVAVIAFLYQSGGPDGEKSLMNVFGDADAYSSLLWGALLGLLTAFVLIVPQRIIGLTEMGGAAGHGMLIILPALVILWLAQTLSSLTGDGDTQQPPTQVAKWMAIAEAGNADIAEELNDHSIPAVITALGSKDKLAFNYLQQQNLKDTELPDRQAERRSLQTFERELRNTELFLSPDNISENLIAAGFQQSEVEYALKFVSYEKRKFGSTRSQTKQNRANDSFEINLPEALYINRDKRLYTGDFLSAQLEIMRDQSPFLANYFTQLLPTFVFLVAGVIAFSTGTSWGTMGIVMPLVIPLTYSQIEATMTEPDLYSPIMLCCIGSVLAGAIFGDHCSPISDTTVLSSQASGCNHIAHVKTQLPYALVVALCTIIFGTLPVGFGMPVVFLIPLGVIMLLAFLFVFGTRSTSSD